MVGPLPQTTTFASGASPDGLQLELSLNATTMTSDGAIIGQVAVVNTSDQNVNVSTLGRSQNVTEWSNYINVCPSDYFMGYAVFGGHFTAANISSAGTPRNMVPPMFPNVPDPIGPGTVIFLPSRGQATGRVVDPDEPSMVAGRNQHDDALLQHHGGEPEQLCLRLGNAGTRRLLELQRSSRRRT